MLLPACLAPQPLCRASALVVLNKNLEYQCAHKEPYFILGLAGARADKIQFR